MHLETIQHLRGLAVAYDDLVPIAKPLLFDLLDSYERHADKEHRLLSGLVESERELAEIREAGTLACWQPIETAPKDGTLIDLWLPKSRTRTTRCYWGRPQHACGENEGYCDACPDHDGWVDGEDFVLGYTSEKPSHWMPMPAAPDAPETSVSPKYLIISDERRTHGMVWFYAPDSKGYTVCTARAGRFTEAEAAAILAGTSGELSALRESDLPKLQILHHIDRGYGNNGAILKTLITHVLPITESPPVNTVNPVNPVPAPETFEAHGHTWTRHTPGDPCPVPYLTKIYALDAGGSFGPYEAGTFIWADTRHQTLGTNIIGWRHAEPQPSTPDK